MATQQKTYTDLINNGKSYYLLDDTIQYNKISDLQIEDFNNISLIDFIIKICKTIINDIYNSSYVNKSVIDYTENITYYTSNKDDQIETKITNSTNVDENLIKGFMTNQENFLKYTLSKKLYDLNESFINIATIITNLILNKILIWKKKDSKKKNNLTDIIDIVYNDIIDNITNELCLLTINNVPLYDYINLEAILNKIIIKNILNKIIEISKIDYATDKDATEIGKLLENKFKFVNINFNDAKFKNCFSDYKNVEDLYQLIYKSVFNYIKTNKTDGLNLPLIFQDNDYIDNAKITTTTAIVTNNNYMKKDYIDFIKFIEFVKFLYNFKIENNDYNSFVFNAIMQVLFRCSLNDVGVEVLKTALLLILDKQTNVSTINGNEILEKFKDAENSDANILCNTEIDEVENVKTKYTNVINNLSSNFPAVVFNKIIKVYTENLLDNLKITINNEKKFNFKELATNIAYDNYISDYIYELEKNSNETHDNTKYLVNNEEKKTEIKNTFGQLYNDNLEMQITNVMKYDYKYNSSNQRYDATNTFDKKIYLEYRIKKETEKIKKKSEKDLEKELLCINSKIRNLQNDKEKYFSFILTLDNIFDNIQTFFGKFIFIYNIGGINDVYESGSTTKTKLIGNMYLKNYANLLLNIYINYIDYGLKNLYNNKDELSLLHNYIYNKTYYINEDKEGSLASSVSGSSSSGIVAQNSNDCSELTEEVGKLQIENNTLKQNKEELEKQLKELNKTKENIDTIKGKINEIEDEKLKTSMIALLDMIEKIIDNKSVNPLNPVVSINGNVNNKGIRKTQELRVEDMKFVSNSRLGYASVWGNAMIREMNKRGGIKGGAEITEITDKEIKGLVQIIQNYLINHEQNPKEDLKDVLNEVLNKVELHNKIVNSLNKTMKEIEKLEEDYNKKMIKERKTEIMMSGGDSRNYNELIKKAYNLDVRRQQLQSEIIEKFNSLY